MIWREFAAAAPTLAQVGRDRFERAGLAIIATLRGDGSPRISPIEPHVALGHLLFAAMPSAKRRDLFRDPRCALHSLITDPNGAEGEFKLYGRAVLVEDRGVHEGDYDAWWKSQPSDKYALFSLDIESVAFVAWDIAEGQMTLESWTIEGGLRARRRAYP